MFKQQMWLVKNGIRLEETNMMSKAEIYAASIVFTQFQSGHTFDFETQSWIDPG